MTTPIEPDHTADLSSTEEATDSEMTPAQAATFLAALIDPEEIRVRWVRMPGKPQHLKRRTTRETGAHQVTFINPLLPHARIEVAFYVEHPAGRWIAVQCRGARRVTCILTDPETGATVWSQTEGWAGRRYNNVNAADAAMLRDAEKAQGSEYTWSGTQNFEDRWAS